RHGTFRIFTGHVKITTENSVVLGDPIQIAQTGSGVPTAGSWYRGDQVVNPIPTLQGGTVIAGWLCTAAGSPGTWIQVGSGPSGTTRTIDGVTANHTYSVS